MTARWHARCVTRVLAALLLIPIVAPAQSGDTLIVGTYAYGALDRVGAIRPLADYLAETLQRPTRAVAWPDPVALAQAVRDGQVDVLVTNTFGYLLLTDGERPAAVPVATFHIPRGVATGYGAVIATRDTSLHTTRDLVTRLPSMRMAFVSPGSTTGNLIPRLHLASVGIPEVEQRSREVLYAGTHAATVDMLRSGRADVVALASEEYDKQAAADSLSRGAWRALWRSPDIQLGPVAVRATLPQSLRQSVARAVVGLERHSPAAFAAVRGGWVEARRSDAFVAADDHTYDAVRRLFGDPATTSALIARFAKPETTASQPPATPRVNPLFLDPGNPEWTRPAPAVSHLRFETSKGVFVLELVRANGPIGADRLYNLARLGYYDDTRVHRVRAGYIAQWGLHGDSAVNAAWKGRYLRDDPPRSRNARGTFAFSYEGPGREHTRNTQLYVNLADNARNDAEPFTILGTVIEGMAVLDSLYSGYGEESGSGVRQGKQGPLERGGNAYMDREFPRLDRIIRVTVRDVSHGDGEAHPRERSAAVSELPRVLHEQ